jgi:WD40 repeat protein
MRVVRLCRLDLAVAFAVLAVLVGAPQASAQDRLKIEVTPQVPHSREATSVAFSPDGARLLSGGDDTLKLWDAATGRLIRTFEGHSRAVREAAFSPDGKRIVSGSDDTTIRIWDAADGGLIATLIGARDGRWLAVTPAGFFAASEKDTELVSVVRGLESYPVAPLYDQLHRPDLVAELLKGDPQGKYKDAAGRLDLEKVLDSAPARTHTKSPYP